jgi:hypothetical protein
MHRRPLIVGAGIGLVLLVVGAAALAATDEGGDAQLTVKEPRSARTPTTERQARTTVTAPATTTQPPTTTTSPPPTTTPPPPTTTPRPSVTAAPRAARQQVVPKPPPPPPPPPSSPTCHPSYQGECLPPDASDVDCAGGSGDGPVYAYTNDIRMVGPDDYGLDSDRDGYGCES